MIFYLSSRGAPKSPPMLLYHVFLNLSNYAPRVKCVKTILSLCQPIPPPTRVTCIIWSQSQINAAWLASYDEYHTTWLIPHDLAHILHAACPLSRTTSWLASRDPRHHRDSCHMICVTTVTPPTWSMSRWWRGSPKWRLLGNSTAVNCMRPKSYIVTQVIGLTSYVVTRTTWSGSHSVTYIIW